MCIRDRLKGRAVLNFVDALNVSWMDIFSLDWNTYSDYEKLVILGTGLAVLVAIAYYVVSCFRELAYEDRKDDDTFLAEFQQLKSEGKISSTEYERVKSSAIAESSLLDKDVTKDVTKEFEAGLKSRSGKAEEAAPIGPTREVAAEMSSEIEIPDIEPNDAPPISLAEALARKKAEG